MKKCSSSPEKTIFCADIGTSSLKTALISESGEVFAFSQQNFAAANPYSFGKDAIASQWLFALANAAKSFGKEISTVEGICISGNGPTIVSEDGTTLLWNDEIPEKIRKIKTPSLFIPRILAFEEIFGKNYAQRLFSGPEFLIHQLTGNAVSILPEARYEKAYWNDAELEKFGVNVEKLPAFVPPSFCAGKTMSEISRTLGLSESTPVFCGAPDFIVALIGTNTLSEGKLCDCAGSSEGLNLCTALPLTGDGIRTLPSVIPGLWNAGVLFSSSGKKFSAFKKEFEKQNGKNVTYAELTALCATKKSGEGYKIMRDLAENIKTGFEILEEAAKKAGIKTSDEILVTGGQAKSEAWIQMKADITGRTFSVCNMADSELLGDAVLALVGLGRFSTIRQAADTLVKTTKKYTPNSR